MRLWRNAREFRHLLHAYDTSTPEGRSKERYRRAALTTLTSALARGLLLLTMVISVPLTVHYLGNERYALWMVLSSVVAMLGFADFGIGNGLLNVISESHGRDDSQAAAGYISSALMMLTTIAVAALAAFALAYPYLPWKRMFNLTSETAIAEAGPAAAVFFVCFLASLPLGVVQRVQAGYQEGYVANLWQAAGSLLGLAGLIVGVYFRAGLSWLVLSMTGAPVFTSLLNSIYVFGLHQPWLRPKWSLVSFATARKLLMFGFAFFTIQIAVTVGYQSANLIVAQVLGAPEVTQYAIPLRMFSILPTVLFIAFTPLWPAYGEATSRGDADWIRKTLRHSLRLALGISVPVNLLLLLVGRPLLHLWVGSQVTPSTWLLVGLALWGIINGGLSHPLAMFLNGVSEINVQAVLGTLMAAVSIVLSISLTRRFGVSGVVYGTVIAQVTVLLIPLAFYIPRVLARPHFLRPTRLDSDALIAVGDD